MGWCRVTADYELRLRAINDGLRLVRYGPEQFPTVGAYVSSSGPPPELSEEVWYALDIARFLLDEEEPTDAEVAAS